MIRSHDYTTISGLRRAVIELELENERLRRTREHVQCGECRYCDKSPEGVFRRCTRQGMRIVAGTDYCSEGKKERPLAGPPDEKTRCEKGGLLRGHYSTAPGEKAMSTFYEQAIRKLDEGVREHLDRYGEVMKQSVRDALAEFCRQDEEFAQAVAQGGSFKDCMAAVAKGIKGGGISDMEAYGLAVKFFFPGAGIDVKMSIDLCASVKGEEPRGLIIDLTDFF